MNDWGCMGTGKHIHPFDEYTFTEQLLSLPGITQGHKNTTVDETNFLL